MNKKLSWVLVLAIVLLVLIYGYLTFGNKISVISTGVQKVKTINVLDTNYEFIFRNAPVELTEGSANLRGKLVLSLTDNAGDTLRIKPFTFDLGNERLEEIVVAGYEDSSFVVGPFSESKKRFPALLYELRDEGTFAVSSVIPFEFGADGKNAKSLSIKLDVSSFSYPVFSLDNRFVFSKNDSVDQTSEASLFDLGDVVIVKGNEIFLNGDGFNPVAFPYKDSSVLFIGNGLEVLDTKDFTRKPIYNINIDAEGEFIVTLSGDTSQRVAASDNGKYIAWTIGLENETLLLRVDNVDPFEISLKTRYPFSASWSTFSPDGKYLAVQTSDNLASEDVPVIEVYDIVNNSKVYTKRLDGYANGAVWLSDWIY